MYSLNDIDSKVLSKQEIASKFSGTRYVPMLADDYIALIVDAKIVAVGDYQNPNNTHPEWEITALNYALKGGGTMKKAKTKEKEKEPYTTVAAFEHAFRFRINPTKMGFMQDKATPSLARGFIAYLLGVEPQDAFEFKANIVLDPKYNIVTDQKILEKYTKEVFDQNEPQELRSKGYTHFKDLRQFVGKYLCLKTQVTSKMKDDGEKLYEKITTFSRMPETFVRPQQQVEEEAVRKYFEDQSRMEENRKKKEQQAPQAVQTGLDDTDEIQIQDVPF